MPIFLSALHAHRTAPAAYSKLLRALLCTGTLATFALSGCGLGSQATTADPIIGPAIKGVAFGGPIPISGATVKIYATGNSSGLSTGYGVGTLLQEANQQGTSTGQDTTFGGAFLFAGGYTCPAGQFVYIVASGGNTGSGINANSVLVAALGRCEDLYNSSNVYTGGGIDINELTTIAAAYSLGHFSTTSGSGAATVIGIGAPAANNAAQVGSVSTGNLCTAGTAPTATDTVTSNKVTAISLTAQSSCPYTTAPTVTFTPANGDPGTGAAATASLNPANGTIAGFAITHPGSGYQVAPTVTLSAPATYIATAGLAHAFQNAANLVNVFPGGTVTSANSTVPGNSKAIVPQQLIDTLGNILLTCVNSAGGVAGDSSACGNLFTATTNGSSVPTSTFAAMVNLAANPTLNGSTTAVVNFYNLASAFTLAVYTPTLSTSTGLNDFSIAINYPSTLGLKYPLSGAVDLNDVYYVGNSAGAGTTPANVLSFSSNGTLLGTSGTNANFGYAYGLSVDALGNGYFGNGSKSGSNALAVFTTGGGSSLSTPNNCMIASSAANFSSLKVYATAVDAANTVWVGGTTNSGSLTNTLYDIPTPASYFASAGICGQSGTVVAPTGSVFANAIEGIATGTAPSNGMGVAVDPDQNIWTVSTTNLAVAVNGGTIAAPTYTGTAITATTLGSPAIGIAFAGSPYVGYISSYNTAAGVQSYTPAYTTGVAISSLTAGTLNSPKNGGANAEIAGSYNDEADGAGIIWMADVNSKSVIAYNPSGTPVAYRYIPVVGGTTTPTSIFGANKPFNVSIDSAGSIWVATPVSGTVAEIIGSAAPTWPLLSLGKVGLPQ